ncbi:MAG: Uma2 family endonuclease [Cyanobacteriota bacterium]|nr:Uma2 family endonuclease [Cyanobacteriota bacterium]
MTSVLNTGDIASEIMSLEDYLNYDDGTETRYELEDGKLRVMPTESDCNQRIASFLFVFLAQLGIPFYRLRIGAEVAVSGVRSTVRLPDLTVLTEEGAQALVGASRSIVTLDMPPPQLVVEVVSPGKENENRDYRYKRSQYQARGICEYWIVDPMQGQITVLNLVEGLYEEAIFKGEKAIASVLLTKMGQGSTLKAAQVFDAGSH